VRTGDRDSGPSFWRRDIQGLRGLAVAAVVAFHLAPDRFPGGFLGVDVFFVVSGFVVFGHLIRRQESGAELDPKGFILRRIERLAPAFVAAVLFGLVVLAIFVSPEKQSESALTAILALFLLANVATDLIHSGYFAADAGTNLFLHLWSFAVEEQFYLAVSALMVLGPSFGRVLRSRRLLVRWSLGLSLLSFSLAVMGSSALALPFGDSFVGFYSPLTRVWEFGVGILAYVASGKIGPRRSASGTFVAMASLTVITGFFGFWHVENAHPGWWTLAPLVCTFLLITHGSGSRLVDLVLGNRFITFLGNMSYSLYLWHWVVIVAVSQSFGRSFGTMALALALSFLLGYLSWVLFENRHGAAGSR